LRVNSVVGATTPGKSANRARSRNARTQGIAGGRLRPDPEAAAHQPFLVVLDLQPD
jgi:hypothetical protein